MSGIDPAWPLEAQKTRSTALAASFAMPGERYWPGKLDLSGYTPARFVRWSTAVS